MRMHENEAGGTCTVLNFLDNADVKEKPLCFYVVQTCEMRAASTCILSRSLHVYEGALGSVVG
jgi:hypothetical protein